MSIAKLRGFHIAMAVMMRIKTMTFPNPHSEAFLEPSEQVLVRREQT